MVHHTMPTSTTSASRASSRISSMRRVARWTMAWAIVGTLAGCGGVPQWPDPPGAPNASPVPQPPLQPPLQPPPLAQPAPPASPAPAVPVTASRSRWTPVPWTELVGFDQDPLHEAWNAWLRSCERPPVPLAALCPEVRRLAIGTPEEQRAWMRERLQPWRIEPHSGPAEGLLTAYYEPLFEARRQAGPGFEVPLHALPEGHGRQRPWYSRQEIDTLPQARALLRGREIAWLADPVDALMLQIQGSGRLLVTEADGSRRLVRLAYAGSNDHPYRSVGGWLLQQGAVRDASWPGIKAWVRANPQRVQEMLWSNPRTVFFREEPLSEFDAGFGPRGAQGVALTPGRSIAVDKESVPYGTPVWLASPGPQVALNRLVMAQDTGSAIVGAVRADWFVGWGAQAGEVAGRLKQPLRLWALWPRGLQPPGSIDQASR
ncbi:murein transglycosylase A [Ramlibacter rhizophilus]|uniref:peptidoglycan lytic exotransglycosylase n=1 Tax=Ramlibacter rhizophilus TaxID=1781167 RepID=A0A4Z0BJR5_9BURK|nr:MltA domain-containing protein [Ramlibacter rhizophilus]TFY98138.1 transglycosylase [Ramlibacter rhizophilus]